MGEFLGSHNNHPLSFLHSSKFVILTWWWSNLMLNLLIYFFIWVIFWRVSEILAVTRNGIKIEVIYVWHLISCLADSYITLCLWIVSHKIMSVYYTYDKENLYRPKTQEWYRSSNTCLRWSYSREKIFLQENLTGKDSDLNIIVNQDDHHEVI